MRKQKEYDMNKIQLKYAIAKIEKNDIVSYTVVTFIMFLLAPIIVILCTGSEMSSFFKEYFSTFPMPLLGCLLICGAPYAIKTMAANKPVILIPFCLAIGIAAGWIITPILFFVNRHYVKKYEPIIEEDRKQNPELYIDKVLDTVNFLIGDKEGVSRSYVTEEVTKYREWLLHDRISRDEYVQLLRGLVNK